MFAGESPRRQRYAMRRATDWRRVVLKVDRMTKSQWDRIPDDYKTVIDGQRYVLKCDDERGTVLVPVEVVDEPETMGSGLQPL